MYKDYFNDFYNKQKQKVKKKIIWTLRLIETQKQVPKEYLKHLEGTDGLYDTGLRRYGYVIGEDISFITESQNIVGDYSSNEKLPEQADLILIEGDNVTLRKYENGYT